METQAGLMEELGLGQPDIADNATNKKAAYENILWALINSKEFGFIQ